MLQGWSTQDYLRCVGYYDESGVDLTGEPLVGVGSVCRRQHSREVRDIVAALRGLRLHGFGMKLTGLRNCAESLVSADSLAWSWAARAAGRRGWRAPGCAHSSCANCPVYAAAWHRRVTRTFRHEQLTLPLAGTPRTTR